MNADATPRIERLTPAQRADYLGFFDHERGPALAGNPEWAACYCHFHHLSPRLDWHALDGAANRTAMDARIACGEMDGYLAYRGDDVIGWLNAQPRHKLEHCDARIGVVTPPRDVPDHEAAAIVCFVVAPMARWQGIARALLSAALDDLAVRGIRIADAYPASRERHDAPGRDRYRGPRTLFAAAGFVDVAHHAGVRVMRKVLRAT